MSIARPLLIASIALSAAACGAESSPSAHVLLDRTAREAGYGLSIEPSRYFDSPILPVSIAELDEVSLVAGSKHTKISVLQGELAFVSGPDARVTYYELGSAIPDGRLIIEATRASADALANTIGGTVEEESRDRVALVAPDIYALTAFLDPPAGVSGAMPAIDRGDEALGVWTSGDGELVPSERLATFVGYYVSDRRVLLVDAAGRFELTGCDRDPIRGRVEADARGLLLYPEGEAPIVLPIDGDSLGEFHTLEGDAQ